jgi:tRNA(Arg) A34 adenosine deaminase TadA
MQEQVQAFHLEMMRAALRLSREKMAAGLGGPFGAIVARGTEIVAEGWNQVTSTNDPTAHAEITAIRAASRAIHSFDLRGHSLYTSCEPCPMCLGAIYWARLDAVYYANTREDAALIGFDDDHIYREFAKTIEGRDIPFVKLDLPEAAAAFQAWTAKPDKILY